MLTESLVDLERRRLRMVRECGQLAAYIARRRYYGLAVAKMPRYGTIGWRLMNAIRNESSVITLPVPIAAIKDQMFGLAHYGPVLARMLERGLVAKVGYSDYELADLEYEPGGADDVA